MVRAPLLKRNKRSRRLTRATVVVGAGHYAGTGAAYVFVRDNGGTPTDPSDDIWSEQAKLTGSDSSSGDFLEVREKLSRSNPSGCKVPDAAAGKDNHQDLGTTFPVSPSLASERNEEHASA